MKTAANKLSPEDAREKIWDLIKDIRITMMVTQDAEGRLDSRPMSAVVHDRAKIDELWAGYLKTWFPKGKDDPNIALICVEPVVAKYWDEPSSTFIKVFGYMKAKITGKPENMGENQFITL